jgi:hypothetical protein
VEKTPNKLTQMLEASGEGITAEQAREALEFMTDSINKASTERDALNEKLKDANGVGVKQRERINSLESLIAQLEKESNKRDVELQETRAKIATLAERENLLSRNLTDKELQVQRERAELHEQFADRETSLRQEMENQQAALREREAALRAQNQELMVRTQILESDHFTQQKELKQLATEHEKAIADLVRQKEQYEADFQKRMESKATEYVDTALGALKASEERFDSIGSKWALGGMLGVLTGLVLAYLLATEATEKIISNKDISWSLLLFFGAKGAILLGLVVAMVRLCMRLARNFMQESLKSAERRHAINYGKFYLSVYGAGTDGEKLKDVFAHWNISGPSAFAEKDDSLSQPSISEIGELTKALVGFRKGGKEDDKD